jgi:iron transport multicopper oxidase
MTAAQRFSVLVTAKNSTDNNYYMHADMDSTMFDTIPEDLNPSKAYTFFIKKKN